MPIYIHLEMLTHLAVRTFCACLATLQVLSALRVLEAHKTEQLHVCFCATCCYKTNDGNVHWALASAGKLLRGSSRYYHASKGCDRALMGDAPATFATTSQVHAHLCDVALARHPDLSLDEIIALANDMPSGSGVHTSIAAQQFPGASGRHRLPRAPSMEDDDDDDGGHEGGEDDAFSDDEAEALEARVPGHDGAKVISIGGGLEGVPEALRAGLIEVRHKAHIFLSCVPCVNPWSWQFIPPNPLCRRSSFKLSEAWRGGSIIPKNP